MYEQNRCEGCQDPSLTLEDEGTSAANASIRRGVGILQFARIKWVQHSLNGYWAKRYKSFLLLFFKKEGLNFVTYSSTYII